LFYPLVRDSLIRRELGLPDECECTTYDVAQPGQGQPWVRLNISNCLLDRITQLPIKARTGDLCEPKFKQPTDVARESLYLTEQPLQLRHGGGLLPREPRHQPARRAHSTA